MIKELLYKTFSYKKEDSYNQESMNIIINDCDCSDGFFVDICSSLLNEGIEFQVVKNCKGINIDGSTVITLDQLYNSGKTIEISLHFSIIRGCDFFHVFSFTFCL